MDQDKKPLFMIDDDPVVDWPVTVKLPADGGKFNEYQFTASMRVLTADEYEALFAEAPGNIAEGESLPPLSVVLKCNVPLFQRVLTGWKGVADRNGEVLYTPEKLAEQVTGKYGAALSAGLWKAVSEIRYGARLGN